MFKVDSEQALLDAFRPRDRPRVQLPAGLKLPLIVRDYFSWTDPSGFHVYCLFAAPSGPPTAIAFTRSNGGEAGVAGMCDWCHSMGGSDEVGLLTTDLNSKKRLGVMVCLDLSCKHKLEDAANRAGKSAQEATRRMTERLLRFAGESLQIDLAGGR